MTEVRNAGRWVKGQSGNPGGRMKQDKTVRDLARTHTADAIKTLYRNLRAKSERAQVAAAEALLNRGWGLPRQQVELGRAGEFANVDDTTLAALLYQRLVAAGVEPCIAHRMAGTGAQEDREALQGEFERIRDC